MTTRRPSLGVLTLLACGCSAGGGGTAGLSNGVADDSGTTDVRAPTTTEAPGSSSGIDEPADTSSSSDDGPKLDVGPEDDPPPDVPDTFEPVLKWSFGEGLAAETIPLVANLTDDDGNGSIDLCDTPDVVLITTDDTAHVIDGATGEEHTSFTGPFGMSSGAIADLDADGTPEILTTLLGFQVAAWTPTGEQLWTSDIAPFGDWQNIFWSYGAIAVHDMDGSGTPEVLINHAIYDATGSLVWGEPEQAYHALQASTAVDLDQDGGLDFVTSHTAWSFASGFANAQPIWNLLEAGVLGAEMGIPHPADFDDDGEVEVLYTFGTGFLLVDHDGALPWGTEPIQPALEQPLDCIPGDVPYQHYQRPAAIADFDADGRPDVAVSTCSTFAIYSVDDEGMTAIWETPVQDGSGSSGASAFDFLGDGHPEPIYSDETNARAWSAFEGDFQVALEVPRYSGTWMEYPIVADVDNGGSAEFLVVSMADAPALQVYSEAKERWIQARRIYNQHTYHAVHVREDATIPATYAPHWLADDAFRVNAAIDNPPGQCHPAG